MKERLFAGLLASAVLIAPAMTDPAQASCKDGGRCGTNHSLSTKSKHKVSQKKIVRKTVKTASKKKAIKSKKRVKMSFGSGKPIAKSMKRKSTTHAALAVAPAAGHAKRGTVVSLIQNMAPSQGVPTWFAMRIAQVESNYNPYARGTAGEYGVFQIKCPTARGIGYSGDCSGLLDPATNVRWGLKHLSLAIGKSGGNLRMAASKHNGGLGRRTEVAAYVAKVF
jgi:soluble lytic murein transglycosylase-like protein